MFECPICQATMEEQPSLVTACCGAEVHEETIDEAEVIECPICGMEDPQIVEGELRLVCENCGYTE